MIITYQTISLSILIRHRFVTCVLECNLKGAKNVPVKGADDKRQITTTFSVSSTGNFLPIQLIYTGKTN